MRDVLYVWEVELKFKAEINVFMVTCYTIRILLQIKTLKGNMANGKWLRTGCGCAERDAFIEM